MKDLLGLYAHKASAELLCGKKDAASFSNFANKRFIYFEEPEFKQKIRSYLIKELTGGNEFSARKLYSTDTSNQLSATFALNTNSIPRFTQADSAMGNRLITITWNTKFTKNPDKVDPENGVFLANPKIGSTLWNEKYLPHLFNHLLKYHNEWMENGEVIPETETQKEDNDDILKFSDSFKNWMDAIVVKTNKKRDYVKIEDLKKLLCGSEFWSNLSKSQKAVGAEQFLKRELRDRDETRSWLRKQKTINGEVKYFWNLSGHILKTEDKENVRRYSGVKRLRSKSSSQFNDLCLNILNTINDNTNNNNDEDSEDRPARRRRLNKEEEEEIDFSSNNSNTNNSNNGDDVDDERPVKRRKLN